MLYQWLWAGHQVWRYEFISIRSKRTSKYGERERGGGSQCLIVQYILARVCECVLLVSKSSSVNFASVLINLMLGTVSVAIKCEILWIWFIIGSDGLCVAIDKGPISVELLCCHGNRSELIMVSLYNENPFSHHATTISLLSPLSVQYVRVCVHVLAVYPFNCTQWW